MDYNRVIWGSRRGMLELDLMLLPFVQERYRDLSEYEQALFHKLLICEDQDMFAWLLRREEPDDAELALIVRLVCEHAQNRQLS